MIFRGSIWYILVLKNLGFHNFILWGDQKVRSGFSVTPYREVFGPNEVFGHSRFFVVVEV